MNHRAPLTFETTKQFSRNLHRRRASSVLKATSPSGENVHLLSPMEDDETRPTVALILNSRDQCAFPALPFSASFEDSSIISRTWNQDTAQFSHVPLTPPSSPKIMPTTHWNLANLELEPQLANSKASSYFSDPVRALLPWGFSLASFHFPTTALALAPGLSCPWSARTKSNESVHSTRSTDSYLSVDSGHKSLIPSIGTTAKFTHKWPAPEPLRKVDLHSGDLNESMGFELSQAVVASMEAGQGLKFDETQTWTVYNWCLLLSVLSVFVASVVGLTCAVMTWFKTWDNADVMNVADNDILVTITLTATMLLFTALVGLSGVFLSSRPILALYVFLLWPTLVSIAAIGYVSYKRVTFALDHKLNLSWSRFYTPLGRLLIQDALQCCGYFSPLHGGIPSNRCYPRSPLPGCKAKLLRFERDMLTTIWSAAFTLAAIHIFNIFIALLCANHLTRVFGRGITPRQYRLTGKDVTADAGKILEGLDDLKKRTHERSEKQYTASSNGQF